MNATAAPPFASNPSMARERFSSIPIARILTIPVTAAAFATTASAYASSESDCPCPAADYVVLPPDPPLRLGGHQIRVVAEGGFIATISNYGEFGDDASRIDFRDAAGQDNLSFYTRWSAELELGERHTFVLLYQPLSTEGVRNPTEDERYEGVTFAAGRPVRTEFDFPFYRLSYLYDVTSARSGYLALGLTGQIRNANYTFTSLDGETFSRTSSVGFVPALKVRGEVDIGRSAFVGAEADGIYAPISVINGSSNETVGAILDLSLRAGVRVHDRSDVFVNLRYLGGGATNEDPAEYAKNWLHLMFVGLGASLDFLPQPTRLHRMRR